MAKPPDTWYVHLPDGRVVRAASTGNLREHLEAGRIPLTSRARRSPDEEWMALEWISEFSDLVRARPVAPASPLPAAAPARAESVSVASRLDPGRLQLVGVRGLLEELLAAVDASLVPAKLAVSLVGLLLAYGIVHVALLIPAPIAFPWMLLPAVVLTAALLVLLAWAHALLLQMTYVELSRLRPARWAEARAGWPRQAAQLALAYLVLIEGPLLLLAVFRSMPAGLEGDPRWPAWLLDTLVSLAVVLETMLWPFMFSVLLLGPVLVVEGCSLAAAFGQWRRLLRDHFDRVFLSEFLAVLIGGTAVLPFAFPVMVAGLGPRDPGAAWAAHTTWTALGFLALAPLVTYLAVANVFIYLYLRYEFAPRK